MTGVSSAIPSTELMSSGDYTHRISFFCSDSDELQNPYTVNSLRDGENSVAMHQDFNGNARLSSDKGDRTEDATNYFLSSSELKHRKCSAPVLCSTVPISYGAIDQPTSNAADNESFNSLSSLQGDSSRFNLTPDIILSPCGPSSSESNSSKPNSVSAFCHLARKLSQDYLYPTSNRIAHRSNTVADGLSFAPLQPSESTSISTRSSSRRLTNWYYSLTASYKTKLDQFRRIFRGTPVDTDRLLVDYSCALSKNNHGLLLQGRMYVTENWVCFYSKILYEQKIYLAVNEIIAITKEKTARVIPNAIQILYSKNHERFFFTSFASRERTFAILRKVWENCRNHQTMSIEEIMQQVREIYGDDSLAMLEDDDTDADPDLIQNAYPSRARSNSESSEFCPPPETDKGETVLSSRDPWQSDRGFSDNALSEPINRTSTDDADDDEQRANGVPMGRPRSALEKPIGASFSAPVESNDFLNDSLSLNLEDSSLPRKERRSRLTNRVVEAVHTEPELGALQLLTSNQTVKPERKKRSKKRSTRSNAPEPKAELPKNEPIPSPTNNLSIRTEDLDIPVECSSNHDHPGRLYVDTEVPLNIDALFACIFTDSEFFDRLSTSRGTFDMVQSSWPAMTWPTVDQDAPSPESTGNIERTICYTLSLKQRMGPRTCAAVEQQTLLVSESRPGRSYVVDAKVTNQAVPLCNCFCVVSRYCLLRTGRLTSRLRVCSRVVYEKPVFFGAKSIIENTCKSGLTDFFTALTAQLTELATGLNDEDRLTGGYLAARSTNTAISHDGMVKHSGKSREKSKEDKLVTTRNRVNGSTIRRLSGVGESRESGHSIGNSASTPTHGVQGKLSSIGGRGSSAFISSIHSKQSTDLLPFFPRPDRAWLLLAVIGLLLCLFLSMVYSRLVALEQLAKQLSVVHPGSLDQSDTSGYQSDLHVTHTGYQLSESARNRIRVMRDLSHTMSRTLAQMQHAISKVEQSLKVLEDTYPLNTIVANADVRVPTSSSKCSPMSQAGVSCPTA